MQQLCSSCSPFLLPRQVIWLWRWHILFSQQLQLYNAIVCLFCLELIANECMLCFLSMWYMCVAAASSNPMCCNDHLSWGSQNQMNGCSSDQNGDCNSWCQTSCRGGECKLRSGHHKCHCYCWSRVSCWVILYVDSTNKELWRQYISANTSRSEFSLALICSIMHWSSGRIRLQHS